MVNHARTLLVNMAAENPALVATPSPGEEFIDPEYAPTDMPGYLRRLRAVLFGPSPDRVMLNYRARQYMAVIQAGGLGKYVSNLDSRVTYNLKDYYFYSNLPAATYNKIQGPDDWDLVLSVPDDALKSDARLSDEWIVSLPTPTTVRVQHNSEPFEDDVSNLTFIGGASQAVALPGSGMSVSIFTGAVYSTDPAWRVNVVRRPHVGLSDIQTALRARSEGDVGQALGGEGDTYAALRETWFAQPVFGLAQLGAAVLGVIYKTNEIWNAA